MMATKRRRSFVDSEEDEPKAHKRMEITTHSNEQQGKPNFPPEMVFEIINRVPVQSVIRFGSISKYWYNSIHQNPKFPSDYFLQSLKNPSLILCILNLNPKDSIFYNHHMLYFEDNRKHKHANGRTVHKFLTSRSHGRKQVVGFCNGLVCLSKMIKNPSTYDIYSLSMPEVFSIFTPSVADGYVKFHGFGFDSITKEYKCVLIFNSSASIDLFKCIMVFTLGTSLWRKIEIPNPPLKLFGDDVYKAAISSSGVLYWRTTVGSRDMISFDLHREKFQVFQIPSECIVSSTEQQQQQQQTVIVQHLEFKGSLCVAHLEKTSGTSQNNCKVHFYTLNDISRSIWTKKTLLLSLCRPPCSGEGVELWASMVRFYFTGSTGETFASTFFTGKRISRL
ncbi:hypothetical protein MKW92_017918 [Papaver armeniacum]|nr:hypothetical protein MKW92_017918 [Papaver armeniacum]